MFTESELEYVRLYPAINKYSLEKWAKHEHGSLNNPLFLHTSF